MCECGCKGACSAQKQHVKKSAEPQQGRRQAEPTKFLPTFLVCLSALLPVCLSVVCRHLWSLLKQFIMPSSALFNNTNTHALTHTHACLMNKLFKTVSAHLHIKPSRAKKRTARTLALACLHSDVFTTPAICMPECVNESNEFLSTGE